MRSLAEVALQLRSRGPVYWLRVGLLTVIGTYAGFWIGQEQIWIEIRYRIHQELSALSPRPLTPRFTAVVLIGDEEYWLGRPAGRAPLRRDYVAELLCAVADGDPAVIALDLDLRAPDPKGTVLYHPRYARETRELFAAIRAVAAYRPLVLAKTIGVDTDGALVPEADLHEALESPPLQRVLEDGSDPPALPADCLSENADPTHLRVGYIALPPDVRIVPLRERYADGRLLESFALVSAEAFAGARGVDAAPGMALRYGSYIPQREWSDRDLQFSAARILAASTSERRRKLAHKIVIIGGAWHQRAIGRGVMSEAFPTPAGVMQGAFIHANYIEALLDSRLYHPIDKRFIIAMEVFLVLLGAMLFALEMRAFTKIAWLGGMAFSVLAFSYFMLQNIGRFFDTFIPLLIVLTHSLVDQVLDWRSEALEYRALRENRE